MTTMALILGRLTAGGFFFAAAADLASRAGRGEVATCFASAAVLYAVLAACLLGGEMITDSATGWLR